MQGGGRGGFVARASIEITRLVISEGGASDASRFIISSC